MKFLLLTVVLLVAVASLEARRGGRGGRGGRRGGRGGGSSSSSSSESFEAPQADPFLQQLGGALDMMHQNMGEMMAEQGMEVPNLDGLGMHLQQALCFGEELTQKYNEAATECPGYLEALVTMKEKMADMEPAGRGMWSDDEPTEEELLEKFLEDQSCFYKSLDWMDDNDQIQVDVVSSDMEGTVISERLRSVTEMCDMMSMGITEEDLQGEEMNRRWYGTSFDSSIEDEEEVQDPAEVAQRVLDAVRTNAFFSCMYVNMQVGCGESIHAAMQHLDIEQFLAGWDQSAHVGPNLMADYGQEEAYSLAPLFVRSSDFTGIEFDISPGQTVATRNILSPPDSFWLADPNELYTYVIEDNSVENGEELTRFIHYVKVNVQGNDLSTGQAAFAYLPPFVFKAEGNDLADEPDLIHEFLHAVFRQDGELSFEGDNPFPTQTACDGTILGGRFAAFNENLLSPNLAAAHGLTPVAASFVRTPYDGAVTKNIMCEMNVCLGEGNEFPYNNINGVSPAADGECGGELDQLLNFDAPEPAGR